jgi:hypothetical protein
MAGGEEGGVKSGHEDEDSENQRGDESELADGV